MSFLYNDCFVDSGRSSGVNTGFGGSANVRTTDLHGLQVALMQHTQSGVILKSDAAEQEEQDEFGSHVMPSVVRKALLLLVERSCG